MEAYTHVEFIDANTSTGRIEYLIVEVDLNGEKWLVLSVYKQPKVKDETLIRLLSSLLDRCSKEYRNFIMIGDMNVDVTKW